MSTTSAIAVSGLNAASLQLQVSANNIANAFSDGSSTPLRVIPNEMASGGVSARVATASPRSLPTFDPTAPDAYPNKAVARPTAGLAREIVQQMMMARFAFAANAHILRTDAQTTATLVDITV